jgi:hypothetical protein
MNTAVISRVQAFLPQLMAANEELFRRARENHSSVDIEQFDGVEDSYIEMVNYHHCAGKEVQELKKICRIWDWDSLNKELGLPPRKTPLPLGIVPQQPRIQAVLAIQKKKKTAIVVAATKKKPQI